MIIQTKNDFVSSEIRREFGFSLVGYASLDGDAFACLEVPARNQSRRGGSNPDYLILPKEHQGVQHVVHLAEIESLVSESFPGIASRSGAAFRFVYLASGDLEDSSAKAFLDPRIGVFLENKKDRSPLFVFTLKKVGRPTPDGDQFYAALGNPVTVDMLTQEQHNTDAEGASNFFYQWALRKKADRDALSKNPIKTVHVPGEDITYYAVSRGHRGARRQALLNNTAKAGKRKSAHESDAS